MAYEGVPFQRVLTRLTSAEMKAILTAQSLLTGSGDDPPSEYTGEAALSWYDWNQGAGSYTSTSPNYRYDGGRFPPNGSTVRHGRDIRALLETAYNANPTTFLAPLTVLRRVEVTDIANPETSTAGASSKIAIWNQTNYVGVTAPSSLSVMLPLEVYYSSGTPSHTGATAATALAAKPAGSRCIKMGAYSHPQSAFWGIPISSSSTNNKYRPCVFDSDFQTYYRHGLSMAAWENGMTDGASVWVNFWADLRSNGGADIIDHLIIDCGEITIPRFFKLASPTLLETAQALTVSGINTGTDVWTSGTHNCEHGMPAVVSWDSGFTSSPTLTSGVSVVYMRIASSTTFTLHTTRADALAGTSKVDVTNAGSGVTVSAKVDDFSGIFTDATWSTFRTTILLPVLSQAVWDGYASWGIHSDERAMLFDTAMLKYFADRWSSVLAIATAQFPNLKIADYNIGRNCGATRSVYDTTSLGHLPYGSGAQIGEMSSHTNYMQYDQYAWKWGDLAVTQQPTSGMTTAELTWATLVQSVAAERSLFGASSNEFEIWIAPTQGGLNIPEDNDMASEFILHSVMPSAARVGFYNSLVASDTPTIAQQNLALNLIAERDAVIAYTPAVLDPQSDLDADYTRDVITTRVWAGGRWVWRVTPRPAATTTITQNADGVRFVCDSEVLAIGNGRIVNLPSSYASLGYWVVETVSDTPPYPDASVETAITYRRTSTTEITYTTKRPAETVYSRS